MRLYQRVALCLSFLPLQILPPSPPHPLESLYFITSCAPFSPVPSLTIPLLHSLGQVHYQVHWLLPTNYLINVLSRVSTPTQVEDRILYCRSFLSGTLQVSFLHLPALSVHSPHRATVPLKNTNVITQSLLCARWQISFALKIELHFPTRRANVESLLTSAPSKGSLSPLAGFGPLCTRPVSHSSAFSHALSFARKAPPKFYCPFPCPHLHSHPSSG